MIRIEVLNQNWEPGEFLLKNWDKREVLRFEDWLAERYIEQVKKAIDLQRYRRKWVPLSISYLMFKQSNGLSEKTWEATGELKESLKYKKSSRTIGFDNRRKHKGSNHTCLEIARRLEYGDLQVPPRPLFRQVYWYLRKDIEYFVEMYRREIGV